MLLSGAGSQMPCQSSQLNRILQKFIARKEFTQQLQELQVAGDCHHRKKTLLR